MPVRIRLSKGGEGAETRELLFDQDLISIGRDAACTLCLADPLVSKTHARIDLQGGACTITDLHSTNFTYLNGEKLTPDRPSPLSPGARVKIAGFELEFLPVVPSLENLSAGQEKPTGTNGQFSRYLEEWSHLRSQVVRELETFDLDKIALNHELLKRQYENLTEENRRLKVQLENERALNNPEGGRKADSKGNPEPAPAPPPSWAPSAPIDAGRALRTIRTLLNLFTRLSSGQSSFLSEFVVRTTFQTGVALPGYFQSADEAVRYFADPALNDEEFASRQAELETVGRHLILHVMGLLEGYRKSVDDGARRLLSQIDPDQLRQECSDPNKTSGPRQMGYKVFPALLDMRVYRQIKQRLQDLKHEDRGVLEKRYFRTGFIGGYEARVSSAGRDPNEGTLSREPDFR